MRLNHSMAQRYFRRLMAGQGRSVKSFATREWTICPETTAPVPAAVHLPGALDRIKAVSPWRSLDSELASIRGERVHIGATVMHLIEPADIVGPCVYAASAVEKVGYGEQRWVLAADDRRTSLVAANLACTFSGSHFFGSRLLDDVTLDLLAENPGDNVSAVTKPYSHETGYRDLFGLPQLRTVRNARVDRLRMFTEPAFNAHKERRYRELRRRLRARTVPRAGGPPPGIYLRRGRTGEPRFLVNEEKVEQYLRGVGFDVIDPAALAAEEIARRTCDARIVVGVEGSQLSHGIYTIADDGVFLVIQPPDRFALPYKDFADCLGLKFAFTVAEPTVGGFAVRIDEMARLLDLMNA